MVKELLIVDDEEFFLESLHEGLSNNKEVFNTDIAFSVKEAIGKLEQKNYDLIISDIKMPNHSGLDLLVYLNNNSISSAFMAMTAHSSPEIIVELKSLGNLKLIEKPFDFRWFEKMVLDFFESGSGVKGILDSMSLVSILQLLNMDGKTLILQITLDNVKGYVAFKEGEIVDARFNQKIGLDAVYYLIERNEGTIEVDISKRPKSERIDTPFMSIMLEAMRLKDEKSAELNGALENMSDVAQINDSQMVENNNSMKLSSDNSLFDKIVSLNGVEDVVLMDSNGELIVSSTIDSQFTEFIGFAGGIGKKVQEHITLSGLSQILLKSKNDSQLSVLFMNGLYIGLRVSNKTGLKTIVESIRIIAEEA